MAYFGRGGLLQVYRHSEVHLVRHVNYVLWQRERRVKEQERT